MELRGVDRVRYFVPTAICLYLAIVCVVLIVVSLFLVSLQNAVAVTAAGVFGLLMTSGLGFAFWRSQRKDLRYTLITTGADSATNFSAVRSAATGAGWRIVREEAPRRLVAETSVSILDAGERIEVCFDGAEVRVASICDPSVGFSLVGRRHCEAHRETVRQAVLHAEPGRTSRPGSLGPL